MTSCSTPEKTQSKAVTLGWAAALLGLFILLADATTKYATQESLPLIAYSESSYPYGGIAVFANFAGIEFSLVHAINRGAAWGVLANFQVPLLVSRIVLVAVLCSFLLFLNRRKEWRLPLTLIVTGAIGNIIDYFIYGHVIDMFHFILWGYDFPRLQHRRFRYLYRHRLDVSSLHLMKIRKRLHKLCSDSLH